MPSPELDFIVAPTTSTFSVALEPAHNALNSLMLLTKVDRLSGLDAWVTRTHTAFTPEQRRNNQLVLQGLYYALVPDRSWPSFPAYVDYLAAQEPTFLRDRVLEAYAQIPPKDEAPAPPGDLLDLLESKDVFLRFLLDRFPVDHIDMGIESEAYSYLADPPALQAFIITHLREMWETVLAPEWRRIKPLLQASVEAFQKVDLSGLSNEEAVHTVTGQDLQECMDAGFGKS